MAFLFEEEKGIESWLQPFTAQLRMPDYSQQLYTDTRMFWHCYWKLLNHGFSEGQLSDYALQWRWYYTQPYELAMSQSVMHLARKSNLVDPEVFQGFRAYRES